MLPKMTLKAHHFVSRLTVFNETFCCLDGSNDICMLWNEAVSGRCAADLVSAYFKMFNILSDFEHFTIWSDNCCGQNKNWTLLSPFWLIVNKIGGPSTIEMKYLEDHTFMRPDSVHGAIGNKFKKEGSILDWNDFENVVKSASKKISLASLTYHDMYLFEDFHKRSPSLPKLTMVKSIKFRKGSNKMFYKTSLSDVNFIEVDFLHPKIDTSKDNFPNERPYPRGLNPKKKEEIVRVLVPHMTSRKAKFWQNLPTSTQSPDLCVNRDSSEEAF